MLKGYIATKISARLDKSHPYYKQFNIHSPDEKKSVGLFAQEEPDNDIIVSIQSGPKEYHFLREDIKM